MLLKAKTILSEMLSFWDSFLFLKKKKITFQKHENAQLD
jgi:hypothetical protein